MESRRYFYDKENSYSSKPSSPTTVATGFERNVLSSISNNSNDGYSGHRTFSDITNNNNAYSKRQRQY